ncbi:MAG: sugar ABC transporter substrate-binding protein [Acidimicrobiales bacterium]
MATAVLVASVVGAVGSSTPSGAAHNKAKGHVSTAAGVKHAKAELTKYEKIPKFVAPGPAFNVSGASGKTIYSIPVSSTILFEKTLETASKSVASKYGINWVNWVNQGKPTQWVQGMNQAVAQHASLITLFGGANPAALQPQITQAKTAGIPVITGHFYDNGTKSFPSYLAGSSNAGFNQAARLDADWIISHTHGKGQVIGVESSDLGPPATAGIDGMKREFAKYCPKCQVRYIDIPFTTWAKDITPEVQAALAQNPKVTYVLGAYDSMSTDIEAAIRAAGDTGKIHIATYNGDPPYMKQIAQNDAVQMEVGEDPEWLAYDDVDLAMRIMTGQPAVVAHGVLRVFDAKNIKQAGTPPTLSGGYGTAYVKGFTSLWKKS